MSVILDRDSKSHVQPMLDELTFLSVNQRFQMKNCMTMWKIIHGRAPQHLKELFPIKSERHVSGVQTRSMTKLDVNPDSPHLHSFKYRGMKAWNSLDYELQSIYSYNIFKYQIRNHIRNTITPMLS